MGDGLIAGIATAQIRPSSGVVLPGHDRVHLASRQQVGVGRCGRRATVAGIPCPQVPTTRRAARRLLVEVSAPICRGFRLTPASAVPCSRWWALPHQQRSSCSVWPRMSSDQRRPGLRRRRRGPRRGVGASTGRAVLSCSVSWRRSVVVRACTPGTVRCSRLPRVPGGPPDRRCAASGGGRYVDGGELELAVCGGICPQNRALRSGAVSAPRVVLPDSVHPAGCRNIAHHG